MRFVLSLCLPLLLCTGVSAQGFSGGFRAGLNFITESGPVEMSEDGATNYQRVNRTTGFHVGATFAYEFTDLVGVKADLMYSQKGGEFIYDGPAYLYLYNGPDDMEGEFYFGDRSSEADVVNSYIDIPIMAYYKLGKLEIEGGFSAGFLVGSRVSGGFTYSNLTTPSGERIGGADYELSANIDGNYFSDLAGGGSISGFSDTALPGSRDFFPPDAVGAYYNSNSNEKLYRRLDFGLVGGLSYYLNNGLYIGGRYQLGLTDVTNDENDIRITADPDNPGRTFNSNEKDYTRSIQASVGFRF